MQLYPGKGVFLACEAANHKSELGGDDGLNFERNTGLAFQKVIRRRFQSPHLLISEAAISSMSFITAVNLAHVVYFNETKL